MTQDQQINNQQLELSSMTWEQFYETCKPEDLINKYYNVKTIYHSFQKRRISIRDINNTFGTYKHKTYGECECGILYCYEWIKYLNEFSNINKPLTEKNLIHLSKWIYTKYNHFYLCDLKLLLEWILEGKYGKFFGSVDSQLIISAFKEFNDVIMRIEKEIENKKK